MASDKCSRLKVYMRTFCMLLIHASLIVLLGSFSFGFQSIFIFAFIFQFLVIYSISNSRVYARIMNIQNKDNDIDSDDIYAGLKSGFVTIDFAIGMIVIFIGLSIVYMINFNKLFSFTSVNDQINSHLIVVILCSFAYTSLFFLFVVFPFLVMSQRVLPAIGDKTIESNYGGSLLLMLLSLLYPVLFSSFLFLFHSLDFFPFGVWGDISYSFIDLDSFIQLSSLVGVIGINFLASFLVSFIYTYYFYPLSEKKNEYFCEQKKYRNLPIKLLILAFILLTFGGSRHVNQYNEFFHTHSSNWGQEKLKISCIVGSETIDFETRLDETENILKKEMKYMSSDILSTKSKSLDMILWSEGIVEVTSNDMENELLTKASQLASKYSTVFGISYLRSYYSDLQASKFSTSDIIFIVFGPSGSTMLQMAKQNNPLAVRRESDLYSNTTLLSSLVADRIGIIGGSIGNDFDFPDKVNREIGSADFVLVPGYDYGPFGFTHARIQSVRAIENGFMLFRCCANGMSGVYDPLGQPIYEKLTQNEGSGFTVDVPKINGYSTLYSLSGCSWFGFLCLSLSIMMWLTSIVYCLKVELIIQVLNNIDGHSNVKL